MRPASLNGWRVPPTSLRTFKVPGTTRRITLDEHAGPYLVALAADYHRTVRAIDVGAVDDGGYAKREANGAPGRYSNHASGTAVDLNWREEGAQGSAWGARFFAQARNRAAVEAIKRRFRLAQWGGDWRARDYMHWELRPGVTLEQVQAECRRLGIDKDGRRE